MIPYSVFAARISGAGFSAPEVRALSLEQNRFSFRLSRRVEREDVLRADSLEVAFFSWEKQCYEKLFLTGEEFAVRELPEESAFFRSYLVTSEKAEFHRLASTLLAEYSRYIRLKLEGDEEELAKKAAGDRSYEITDLSSHVRRLGEETAELFASDCSVPSGKTEKGTAPAASREVTELSTAAFGLRLDRPDLVEQFLAEPIRVMYRRLMKKQGLSRHPIAACTPSVLCVGNEFCAELFPESQMRLLYRRAFEEKLELVWMLAPMRERDVDRYVRILRKLRDLYAESGRQLTLMVNDFGTADLVQEIFPNEVLQEEPACGESGQCPVRVKLLLGTLLHKKRKDPRMERRAGGRDQLLAGSGLLDTTYRAYLKELGFSGFSAETVGYDQVLPEETEVLFFPWYQTNTAGLCTLAALKERGDRGSQRLLPEGACPMHCMRTACVYPDLPELIGRGNSLFAFDRRSLADPRYLKRLIDQGVKLPVFCPM